MQSPSHHGLHKNNNLRQMPTQIIACTNFNGRKLAQPNYWIIHTYPIMSFSIIIFREAQRERKLKTSQGSVSLSLALTRFRNILWHFSSFFPSHRFPGTLQLSMHRPSHKHKADHLQHNGNEPGGRIRDKQDRQWPVLWENTINPDNTGTYRSDHGQNHRYCWMSHSTQCSRKQIHKTT